MNRKQAKTLRQMLQMLSVVLKQNNVLTRLEKLKKI